MSTDDDSRPRCWSREKLGFPSRVETHHFAVEDEVVERKRLDRARDLGKDVRVVVAVAREQACLAVLLAGEQPITVELELEDPAVARERVVARSRPASASTDADVDRLPNGARLLDGMRGVAWPA